MTERTQEDQAVVRYLLGDATELEMEAFEDALFQEPKMLDRISAVEDELIDDYLRGELEAGKRSRFEKAYLPVPERRERVEFARALFERVRGRSGPSTTGIYPVRHFPYQPLLAAAAVLLVALTVYFAWDSVRSRRELARLRRTQEEVTQHEQALSRELAETRGHGQRLERDLANERAEKDRVAEELARLQAGSARSISYALTATLVRGGGELQTLRIPRSVSHVLLQAPISKPSHATYHAIIRTPEGETAWQDDPPPPGAGDRTLTVKVPANVLAAGDYILTVTGVTASGREEPLLDIAFRVKRL